MQHHIGQPRNGERDHREKCIARGEENAMGHFSADEEEKEGCLLGCWKVLLPNNLFLLCYSPVANSLA